MYLNKFFVLISGYGLRIALEEIEITSETCDARSPIQASIISFDNEDAVRNELVYVLLLLFIKRRRSFAEVDASPPQRARAFSTKMDTAWPSQRVRVSRVRSEIWEPVFGRNTL